MGKRSRTKRDAKGSRERLEELLASDDTRGAVEAAKVLLREEPGTASESLAVRAYVGRIKALIAEGLGREAAAIAAIMRERFPGHAASWTSLFEEARLAAGDFDWILSELHAASGEGRAALEERLLPWIVDPSVISHSTALDPADPLASESRILAGIFEIVTSRIASPEEMAPLNDIRRRSPLAPWKLLIRAIDAYYRNEDERVATNVAAIDTRSPAARGGEVLSELTTGRQREGRSPAAERLIDRITGGRASIIAQIRSIEAAARDDDRRKLREEVRALTRSFDRLSPYAIEQARIALLPICGVYFEPEQIATMFRIAADGGEMPRYSAIVMESTGAPFASSIWMVYAEGMSAVKLIEPWQAAEIYLHVLALGKEDRDPDWFDPFGEDEDDALPDTAQVIRKIIASKPGPSVLARVAPYFDRLESRELRSVLTAWRKNDSSAPEPLVRLLDLATKEGSYDTALVLIRQGDEMKIIDPEYARLRTHVLFRKAEQLLAARKRGAADMLLAEIARRPEDLGEDGRTYLLALEWAAATPAKAGELLAELARRGVAAEVIVAEVTGELGIPFALPASQPSPTELLEGVCRGLTMIRLAGKLPRHCAWLIERTVAYFDRATEMQLLVIGSSAMACRMNALAWTATARGLEIGGAMLYRMLLLRAEILIEEHRESRRTALTIEGARSLAQQANDREIMARAAELTRRLPYFQSLDQKLSQGEIAAIVDYERTAAMPSTPKPRRKKVSRSPKPKSKPQPKSEKGLFEQ